MAGTFEGGREIWQEPERVRGRTRHQRVRLYEARYAGTRAKAAEARQASAFVPVRLKAQALVKVTAVGHHGEATAARLAMQARLDNGVVLSWTYDASLASAQANLLHTLAGLPCFA